MSNQQPRVSQEHPEYLVTIDDVTLRYFEDYNAPITYFLDRHKQHRAKPDCACPWGKINATALRIGDEERMILINEDLDNNGVTIDYTLMIRPLPEWLHDA